MQITPDEIRMAAANLTPDELRRLDMLLDQNPEMINLLGKMFPSLAMAMQQIMQAGGAPQGEAAMAAPQPGTGGPMVNGQGVGGGPPQTPAVANTGAVAPDDPRRRSPLSTVPIR